MPNDDDATMVGDCSDNEAGCGGDGIEVCAFDNRGMGQSSVPNKKSEYTWVFHFFVAKFFNFLISHGFYLLLSSVVDFKWAFFFLFVREFDCSYLFAFVIALMLLILFVFFSSIISGSFVICICTNTEHTLGSCIRPSNHLSKGSCF